MTLSDRGKEDGEPISLPSRPDVTGFTPPTPEEVHKLLSPSSPEGTRSTPEGLLIGQLAMERGLIVFEQLKTCLQDQEDARASGRILTLGQALLRRGFLKGEDLARLVEERARLEEGLPNLPRYDLRGRLGQGATAIVHQAWDRELNRPVAIKILRESSATSELARQRFKREAQAAAALTHPNVLTVFDSGECDGKLYIVMELVQGSPLTEVIRTRRGQDKALIEILEKAARGVAEAHVHGIVHRDLKPANILVTAEGIPKVGDFGLVHLVDSSTELTRTGAILGTPLYMSPEQVAGDSSLLSPRTDVYSLGSILYEMIVGRPPHIGVTATEIYARIAKDDPIPPRKMNPRVQHDLDTITMKAIEKDPQARYPSALEFADDLRRFLAGESIEARPVLPPLRILRKALRNRPLVVAASFILAIGLAGLGWGVTTARSNAGKIEAGSRRARELEKAGKFEETRAEYRKLLELSPDHAEARAGLQRVEAEIARRKSDAEVKDRLEKEAEKLLEAVRLTLDQAVQYLYQKDANYQELVRRVDERQPMIEAAIRKAPHKALGHYLLGRACEIKGLDRLAEESYARAIERAPDLGPAHFRLGRILLARSCMATLGVSPEDREIQKHSVRELADRAAAELDIAMRQEAGFDDAQERELAEAMLAYAGGKNDLVQQISQRALARHAGRPGMEEFHWLQGIASQGNDPIEAFDRAIAVRPKYPAALLCRADARLARGDLEGALADCDAAIEVNPHLWEAHYNRGVVRLRKRDLPGAIADFTKAIEVHPLSVHARINRAIAFSDQGNSDRAIADFNDALGIAPRNRIALFNRGVARLRAGLVDDALADFNAVLELDPKHAAAHNNRGVVFRRKGRLKEAIEDFTRAMAEKPGYFEAINNRGSARSQAGDPKGALADFNEALLLEPNFPDAHYNRGVIRAQTEDLAGALTDLDRAIQLRPSWAGAFAVRAQVREAKKDLKGAEADALKALKLGLEPEERQHLEQLIERVRKE